jgi:tRNA U34 2-thiouridine synthase MnmA/TrmU
MVAGEAVATACQTNTSRGAMMNEGKTVVVGLSGGVDSAVAALLLKQQGWQVLGLFMKNWEDDDTDEYCSSRQDLIDVMSVADSIGIDVEVVNFASRVPGARLRALSSSEYQAGRTPNPDVLCNSEIKFSAFLEHALKIGADRIATGHYAGVREFQGPSSCSRPRTVPRTRAISCIASTSSNWRRRCFRWPTCTSARCAGSPRRPACTSR